jgi:uncharacterized protein involved in copper resistance
LDQPLALLAILQPPIELLAHGQRKPGDLAGAAAASGQAGIRLRAGFKRGGGVPPRFGRGSGMEGMDFRFNAFRKFTVGGL